MTASIISHQVHLPWSAVAELAVKSLKKRFVRSLITMVSVILAIAFLMSMRVNTAVVTGLMEANDRFINAELMKNGVKLGTSGTSSKDLWLVCLSLMVCSVGILNAMLMSVSERFKEIGTMKCLGAMDGFIVRLFMVEACIQGAVGTFSGLVIGLAIGGAGAVATYGTKALTHLALGDLCVSALFTLILGVALSVVFAIYPAHVAASMQPVEAMRVEE